MTVGTVAAVAGLLAVAGCEKAARRDEPAPPPSARDARPAPGRDASLAELLDGLEPVDPAPPPIVRRYRQGDCQPEYAPRPNRDPNPMCKVDGGTFELGAPAAKAAGTPQRTTVQSFYIDQFEVTAAQAARFLNAQGHNECYGPDANAGSFAICAMYVGEGPRDLIQKKDRFVVHPGSEERAVKFTIQGALRYCAWVGKRLPSEAQWEYAARHDPGKQRDHLYAWSDTWEPERAYIRDDNSGPFLPGAVMPVGSFDGVAGRADGSSPWGLHDTVGNAPELTVRCASPDEGCGVGCRCPVITRGRSVASEELTRRSREMDPEETGWVSGVRCARPSP